MKPQLVFLYGLLSSRKYPKGLQANLTGQGTGTRAEKWSDESSSHHLAPEEEGRWRLHWGCWSCLCVFSLVILQAKSGAHRHWCCCFSSPCGKVRCPSQTEHHPQLHASCHDCSSCSNCLLLLWSLQLRCQG